MRMQLAILLTTIHKSIVQLLTVVGAFFLPISGILFLIGFAIMLDTLTGIWKAKKLKIPITSRKLSAIISKMVLYETAVIGFYLIDFWILNDIVMKFFSVPLMLTKIVSLVLVSIETVSINESYKAVKQIDIWSGFKRLFARSAEIKNYIDGVRHSKDSSESSI
jgi:hypothetical protein